MDYQLTPDDLKVETEYYIEFQSHYASIIEYNGTYIFMCNNTDNYKNDVVYCIFKNIKNEKLISLIYGNRVQNFYGHFNIEEKFSFIDCSISELTSGYVLK